jgi:hypothetical protein
MFTNLKCTALLVLLTAVGASAQTPGSLKASYGFSGNTLDGSGNNNNGQIVGNVLPATDRFGQAGCAYLFTGNINSYIEIPLTADFSFTPAQSFSISLWYQGGSLSAGDMEYFWGENAGNSGYFFGLYDLNRVLFHECWAPMSSTIFPSADTAWHHAVAVFDNGDYKVYRDNQLLSSQPAATTAITAPTNNIVIGRGFLGKIDDVRYYNEALDTTGIATLFAMASSCQPTRVSNLTKDLIGNVYPNPASDYIYIDLADKTKKYNIAIYSIQGRLIKEIKAANTAMVKLDITDIPNSSYLLKISAGSHAQSKIIQKIK